MSDGDDTHRHRRPRIMMSDDDRALLDSKRRHTSPFGIGIPHEHAPADVTPVFDVLDDRFRDRRPDMPVTAADLQDFAVQIRNVVRKLRDDGADSERRVADELRQLIAHPPNEAVTSLRQDVDDLITTLRQVARQAEMQGRQMDRLEQTVATHSRLVKLIGGGLMSAIAAIGVFLYTRGASDGGNAVRLEHVERAVDEARHAYEHSFQPGYAPAPINKDKTP